MSSLISPSPTFKCAKLQTLLTDWFYEFRVLTVYLIVTDNQNIIVNHFKNPSTLTIQDRILEAIFSNIEYNIRNGFPSAALANVLNSAGHMTICFASVTGKKRKIVKSIVKTELTQRWQRQCINQQLFGLRTWSRCRHNCCECPALVLNAVAGEDADHRRRINTEEKSKVVAAVWGQNLFNSLPLLILK